MRSLQLRIIQDIRGVNFVLISEEYRFANCELRTMDNDLLNKGKIIKIGSDFLEISNDLGSASLLRYEHKVKVVINHTYLESKVIEGILYIPTMEFFRVIDIKTIMEKEQRNFFRVNVNIDAIVGVGPRGGGPLKRYPVVLNDLSLNGTLMISKAIIAQRTKVELVFEIDNKEITLDGQVVRCRLISDSQYGYGIRFTDIDNQNANQICQYLFKRQKEILEY